MAVSARVAHHLRRIGIAMPCSGHRGASLPTDARSRLPRSRQALARGTAILVRGPCRCRDSSVFRARPALARFMELAGPIIGIAVLGWKGLPSSPKPISGRGYLYGWERVSPRAHLLAGVLVALSGVAVRHFRRNRNRLMNNANGFTFANGSFSNIRSDRGDGHACSVPADAAHDAPAYAANGACVAGFTRFCCARSTSAFTARH